MARILPSQIARLEILGFKWKAAMQCCTYWERNFQQMKRFKLAYGHLKIPETFDTPKYIGLGAWFRKQKQSFIKLTKKPTITAMEYALSVTAHSNCKRACSKIEQLARMIEAGVDFDQNISDDKSRLLSFVNQTASLSMRTQSLSPSTINLLSNRNVKNEKSQEKDSVSKAVSEEERPQAVSKSRKLNKKNTKNVKDAWKLENNNPQKGDRIKIYWQAEGAWFEGIVSKVRFWLRVILDHPYEH
jgi:hypothetical protein